MFRHKDKCAIFLTGFSLLFVASSSLANNAQSIFDVSSNDTANRVNYGIRLNTDCSISGTNPVYSYVRKADGETRSLNSLEQNVYQVSQSVVSNNRVELVFDSLQSRGVQKPITVTTSELNNKDCQVSAFTIINGTRTQLVSVYAQISRTVVEVPFIGRKTTGGTLHSITFIGSNQNKEEIQCPSDCSMGLPLQSGT
ncbi:MAG: DUF4833 domain-containing protein [Chroococcidiopsidaceae cyanobacterium CP_BM_RX_35]|nr:DUF4833 domain-containing protein [Chroococcidiopsidaceae cyanobacterium CP_BM_RX_35]